MSKVAAVAGDAPHLAAAYELIDHYPDILAGQHEIRKWEYGMALRTLTDWQLARHLPQVVDAARQGCGVVTFPPLRICDVGGAGSHFWHVLLSITSEDIVIIDPVATPSDPGQYRLFRGTVEEYCATQLLGQFDVITCISVIEHVVNVRPFLKACRALLKPGGLLFLTTDYTDTEGEDVFHFHWMRERIYNAGRVRRLMEDARDIGFRNFGESDWTYHGHQVYDYSVCSLAMTRKDPNGQHDRE